MPPEFEAVAAVICPDGSGRCLAVVAAVLVAVGLVRAAFRGAAQPPPPPPDEQHDDDDDDDLDDDDDQDLDQLLEAVREHAAHRWPHVHPDEAVERFTVDLRTLNHYYRDKAAAAAAAPEQAGGGPAS